MAVKRDPNMVTFTTKGQVVIPAALRRKYEIKEGTRAILQETPEGLLLKPVGRQTIFKGYGILKPKKKAAQGKTFQEEWADYKKAERALEQRRGR